MSDHTKAFLRQRNFATKFYIFYTKWLARNVGCKITFVRDRKSGDQLWTGNFPDRLLSFRCWDHIFRFILLGDLELHPPPPTSHTHSLLVLSNEFFGIFEYRDTTWLCWGSVVWIIFLHFWAKCGWCMDGWIPLDYESTWGANYKPAFFRRVYCEEEWDLTANGRLYYRWGVDLFEFFTNMQKISIMAFIIS